MLSIKENSIHVKYYSGKIYESNLVVTYILFPYKFRILCTCTILEIKLMYLNHNINKFLKNQLTVTINQVITAIFKKTFRTDSKTTSSK